MKKVFLIYLFLLFVNYSFSQELNKIKVKVLYRMDSTNCILGTVIILKEKFSETKFVFNDGHFNLNYSTEDIEKDSSTLIIVRQAGSVAKIVTIKQLIKDPVIFMDTVNSIGHEYNVRMNKIYSEMKEIIKNKYSIEDSLVNRILFCPIGQKVLIKK